MVYFIFDVLYSTSSLNTTHSKSISGGETAYYSSLIFEGTEERFVNDSRVTQVENSNLSIRSTDNKEIIFRVHTIRSLWQIHRRNRIRF
jgi:hypothetical protein